MRLLHSCRVGFLCFFVVFIGVYYGCCVVGRRVVPMWLLYAFMGAPYMVLCLLNVLMSF